MKKFSWNTVGSGTTNIILLNGWGFNSNIWHPIVQKLKHIFKFYLIDFPGSGKNIHLDSMNINNLVKLLYNHIPKHSIWIGWSLGGLITSYFALSYPKHVSGIIYVASSPCFTEKKNWPGIQKNRLLQFFTRLKKNYHETIYNFLLIQTKNSRKCLNHLYYFKKNFFIEPQPSLRFLLDGMEMIYSIDLRYEISLIDAPILRIYGSLDSFVPLKTVYILNKIWPNTYSHIIAQSAHIPFFSHTQEFCIILKKFIEYIEKSPNK